MSSEDRAALSRIFQTARMTTKGSLIAYENLKSRVRGLDLTPYEYEDAVRKLADLLRV